MNLPVYRAKEIRKIDNGPNVMNSIEVGVFKLLDGEETQVGSYVRNFPFLHRTFHHFRKNRQDFALYSPEYTTTRVMELPSCTDIGGEKPHISFCPLDYYVPWVDEPQDEADKAPHVLRGNFGFVAGVYWGETNVTAQIQYLDLLRAEEGIIARDQRFGDIRLPVKCSLEQAIFIDEDTFGDYPHAYIGVLQILDINSGVVVNH
ncbi:MAG TPA: hypothetical protein PLD25_31440 [Chloroflexota bacterium]|nr:hypothetical protein [Chloroflexota bacterium]HUM68856.1 hypothetical protein [Chloroflexota bacterium]